MNAVEESNRFKLVLTADWNPSTIPPLTLSPHYSLPSGFPFSRSVLAMNIRHLLINLSLSISGFIVLAAGAVGCQTLEQNFPFLEIFNPNFAAVDPAVQAEAEVQREKLQVEQSDKAMRWLLSHVIEPGLTPEEVDSLLGQEGQRVYNDTRYKLAGGDYQAQDEGYRWGPTDSGSVYILFFREGTLVNFDPDEYSDEL